MTPTPGTNSAPSPPHAALPEEHARERTRLLTESVDDTDLVR